MISDRDANHVDRTIIDILRKGNQELFHSSMIAWLLDPKAEHGYKDGFLRAFAEKVAAVRNGNTRLRDALQTPVSPQIRTETPSGRSRYDILLRVGNMIVIIENKTKSLGNGPQFRQYQGDDRVLVALGLCDISFNEEVQGEYPIITYNDVLSIMENLDDPPPSPFRVLVEHYRAFLKRELGLLSEIKEWCSKGEGKSASRCREIVNAVGTYTENDKRFLNLYLLEHLRRRLLDNGVWRGCSWKVDKNMRSGVWLAIPDPDKQIRSPNFPFDKRIATLRKQYSVALWFHVELWAGILAESDDVDAGMVQLRCNSCSNTKQFVKDFLAIRSAEKPEWQVHDSTVNRNPKTICLIGRPLHREKLANAQFQETMNSFAASFGSFK
jgi:hypothetical protein